jgi:non-canonical purine NTP pyrophosphatase (RdgB/HAM1 family)
MQPIPFATGNDDKFRLAQAVCASFGIEVVQRPLDIAEIQAEDGEPIVRDKAEKAYAQLRRSVIVNDDCWIIPALGGFPGPYNKSINVWFTPADMFRLTRPLADRRIILRQFAVFQDEHGQQLFVADVVGTMLTKPTSKDGLASEALVTFDGTHSVAEMHEAQKSAISNRQTVWHQLAPWLKERLA